MLEKLFTSKNRIKIMEFLFFEREETYLREISKELGISPSAVKRELENLIVTGLIKKQRNKIVLNEKSNIIGDLKNIFIKTDAIVYPIKRVLKSNKIKFTLIFGSFAVGDYSGDSDIDLMIIGDMKLSEVYKLLRPVENQIKREINPVVWKLETLRGKKDIGFVRDIFKKKIIMLKGEENEIRKIVK